MASEWKNSRNVLEKLRIDLLDFNIKKHEENRAKFSVDHLSDVYL